MSPDIDTVVIGAGVVGLAVARALQRSGREVMVIERHAGVGRETSARNSEVIHAGLYYPKGSLKALLSAEGRQQLYAFCAENGVSAVKTGKLIIATDDAEAEALKKIAATARANGISDIVELSAAEALALEPRLSCKAALLSPSTGIVDSRGLIHALEGHLASLGGSVVLSARVERISLSPGGPFVLDIESGGSRSRLTSRFLVNAAGLTASNLGRMLPYPANYRVPETVFAKGHYFALSTPPPFRRLVYPVPGGGSLGIHFTLDTGGRGRFGPDIDWLDTAPNASPDYTFDDPDGRRRVMFEGAIRRYWPGLPEGALAPGTTGIRPKISRAGAPAADFALHEPDSHGIAGYVGLYGIESPGLTSSLAIGERVARMLATAPLGVRRRSPG